MADTFQLRHTPGIGGVLIVYGRDHTIPSPSASPVTFLIYFAMQRAFSVVLVLTLPIEPTAIGMDPLKKYQVIATLSTDRLASACRAYNEIN